jgi:hypothetical protein
MPPPGGGGIRDMISISVPGKDSVSIHMCRDDEMKTLMRKLGLRFEEDHPWKKAPGGLVRLLFRSDGAYGGRVLSWE